MSPAASDQSETQARYAGKPWTDTLPDECTCKWANYSDSTRWFLKTRDSRCPRHGDDP